MSQSRRVTFLMAALLALLGYYFWSIPNPQRQWLQTSVSTVTIPALAGENSVDVLEVKKQKNGTYVATVKYFFTGAPAQARLTVNAKQESSNVSLYLGATKPLQRGDNTVDVELVYPYNQMRNVTDIRAAEPVNTNVVVAAILVSDKDAVTSARSFPILWPPLATYNEHKSLLSKSAKTLYEEAVAMIDDGDDHSLAAAKRRLEVILADEPQSAPAHIELARVAMKNNWGPEGLFQAEQFIATALKHEPDSANAKVLQGYVFAHQKRFIEAEKALVDAQAKGTKNLWLWANWGELLEMQGKTEPATEKYLQTLQGERPRNTYDRAREHAYRKLVRLYEKGASNDRLDALHKQRVTDFPEQSCYLAEYATFKTSSLGDFQNGKKLAQDAVANGCKRESAKQALGLSSYYAWAHLSGEEALTELSQARINFAEGPLLLVELAKFERGVPVIRKLVANGLKIDQANNERSTALSIALTQKEHAAARRILRLGAKHTVTTAYGEYPLSLIPLMNRDVEGVKLMREHGVDYSKLKWGNATAAEIARSFGDVHLLKALGLPGTRA